MLDGAAFTAWLLSQGPVVIILIGFMVYLTGGRLRTPQEMAAKDQTIDLLKELLADQTTILRTLADSSNRLTDATNKVADVVNRLVEHRGTAP